MSVEASEIHQRIAKLAIHMGVSINNVAMDAGISPSRFSEWKKGVGNPSLKQLTDIANVLGVPVNSLLMDTAPPVKQPPITDDERSILDLYRTLGLTKRQAFLGLAMMTRPWKDTKYENRLVTDLEAMWRCVDKQTNEILCYVRGDHTGHVEWALSMLFTDMESGMSRKLDLQRVDPGSEEFQKLREFYEFGTVPPTYNLYDEEELERWVKQDWTIMREAGPRPTVPGESSRQLTGQAQTYPDALEREALDEIESDARKALEDDLPDELKPKRRRR